MIFGKIIVTPLIAGYESRFIEALFKAGYGLKRRSSGGSTLFYLFDIDRESIAEVGAEIADLIVSINMHIHSLIVESNDATLVYGSTFSFDPVKNSENEVRRSDFDSDKLEEKFLGISEVMNQFHELIGSKKKS